jgi:acyl dehydratase
MHKSRSCANERPLPRRSRRQTLRLRSTADQQRAVRAFDAEFDPQPFHLDEHATQNTIFKGLAAIGWHTTAVTMRLLVESELKPRAVSLAAGFDEFRWPWPVRPGDELHIESEVLEVRASRSLQAKGWSRCGQ